MLPAVAAVNCMNVPVLGGMSGVRQFRLGFDHLCRHASVAIPLLLAKSPPKIRLVLNILPRKAFSYAGNQAFVGVSRDAVASHCVVVLPNTQAPAHPVQLCCNLAKCICLW